MTKFHQRNWNWPKPRYRKVLEQLKPKRVCSIGTKAHWIEGTEDKRGIPMQELCDILASSKVLLTPSSGPGHLAHLCGCPHVIMTSNKHQPSIGGTNKDRYLKIWAPFKTPCKVLDGHNWQPPVEKVVKALRGFL
jgi:ADP-heptose:LPS heptosyltransferase